MMAKIIDSLAALVTKRLAHKCSFFLLCCLLLGTPALADEAKLHKVSFIPQWIPQAQFAGYYVAHEKGLYRKYNLQVEILRGGPEQPSSDLLAMGRADFGTTFLATAIQKRDQSIPLVNIGQIVQLSSLMLVAKKSSDILSVEDIDGKKVGIWVPEFQVQPKAFFNKFNLAVQIIPQSTTVNLFLRGGVDVASAMWYNEYHLILNSGINPDELTTFFYFDHGLNFPEDGIYCLEKTFKATPELSCNFVKASIEGWKYAFEHPEEALDIVMQYAREGNNPTNRAHQRWMLARMQDIIMPAGKNIPLGRLRAEDYHRVVQELSKRDLITKSPSFSEFFVDCVSHD